MRVWNPHTGQMEEVPDGTGGMGGGGGAGGAGGMSGAAPGFAGTMDQPAGPAPESPLSGAALPGMGGPSGMLGIVPQALNYLKSSADEGVKRDKETEKQKAAELDAAAGAPPVPGLVPTPVQQPPPPSSQTTVQRTIAGPGEKKALEGIREESEKIAGLEEKKGEIKSKVDDVQAKGAAQQAAQSDAQAQQVDETTKRAGAEMERARQKFATEQDKYEKMEIRDYYEGKEGEKVANAIMIGLGELGRVLSKSGRNAALDVINQKESNWYAREREKIAKQRDIVSMAEKGIESARVSKQDALNDLAITGAARRTALADKIEAEAKQIGTPFAIAEGQRMAAEQRKEAHNIALKAAEGLRSKVITEPSPAARAGTLNNDRSVYGPGGQAIAQTATPQQATKANSAISAYRQLDSLMGQLEQSYAEHGKKYNPLSDATGQQKNLQANLKIAYKNAAELGAITGPDMGLIEDAIGGALTGPQGVAKLRAARSSARLGHAAALDSFGLPGAQIAKQLSSQPAAAQPLRQKLSDMDREALNWADANRSDPRAKEILRRHGL